MRIISGRLKGRRIQAPKNLPVRPTTDMAKESLFNILNNLYYFDEISVLDLFAGTGSISLEFFSRGTASIYAVDANFNCIKFIQKISDEYEAGIQTIKSDVFKFLESSKLTSDVIFADPPYDFDIEKFNQIVDLVLDNELLNEGGVLVVEHSKYTDLSEHKHFSYNKKYGGCMFSFFELE